MANHLAGETSPYLLQHAENPVDWWPWSEEALSLARRERKPILLSIGYAACHWCHVMERESFEDDETAALMNEHFVCIKVDREERPDLDAIYMQATQAMTGHGGWPMTVFLTPDGEPFYAGTYFPPEDRHGMPSFQRVLRGVADAWENRQDSVTHTTSSMRELYAASTERTRTTGTLDEALLSRTMSALVQRYDARAGGFDGAPKFPPTMVLDFLLRQWARTGEAQALEMVTHTFRRMARGGICDQVGGGFARYSVDGQWLIPHFEKMTSDNALLIRLGTHLWQATNDAEVRQVVGRTADWVRREMLSPEGGFYTSLDADSEGKEGQFYVFTHQELTEVLGKDADLMIRYWGATPEGNFEGANILHVPHDPQSVADAAGITLSEMASISESATQTMFDYRERREHPFRDEKILASWNGLMLRGVAEAARAFGDAELSSLALRNGEFLAGTMLRDGVVYRSYKDGVLKVPGFLEDYAAVGLGFLSLYNLTFDSLWLERSRQLADRIVALFWDDDANAFFDTANDGEALITRPKDMTDNAIPSGSSMAAELLLILSDLFADGSFGEKALSVLSAVAEPMARFPTAFGHALGVTDMAVRGAIQCVIMGDKSDERFRRLTGVAAASYLPSLILAGGDINDGSITLLAGRSSAEPMAYLCRNYACDAPTNDPAELRLQLESLQAGASTRA